MTSPPTQEELHRLRHSATAGDELDFRDVEVLNRLIDAYEALRGALRALGRGEGPVWHLKSFTDAHTDAGRCKNPCTDARIALGVKVRRRQEVHHD